MIPEYYEFQNRTKILSGKNALENIPFELKNLGAKKPAVLTNSQTKLFETATASFGENGIEIGCTYKNIPADSSVKLISDIAKLYRENDCDSIVAIGGGSVIDSAKGLLLLLSQEVDELEALAGSEIVTRGKTVPFIAVPTTAGTGSEATLAAVIADIDKNIKMEFLSYNLLPDVAVLDVRMTSTLPAKTTASTGMDALTHAIEAYTCAQKNPISDAYAVAAIELIRENLLTAVQHPADGEARLAMANAALMAGVSFSNSMVGLVHAIGHACGGVCHIAHGDAVSILLPHCMEYNLDVVEDLYAALLLPLCGEDVYVATPPKKRATRVITEIQALVQTLNKRSKLPLKLGSCGVTADKLQEIAETAINDGAILMNIKDAGAGEILEILNKAL